MGLKVGKSVHSRFLTMLLRRHAIVECYLRRHERRLKETHAYYYHCHSNHSIGMEMPYCDGHANNSTCARSWTIHGYTIESGTKYKELEIK